MCLAFLGTGSVDKGAFEILRFCPVDGAGASDGCCSGLIRSISAGPGNTLDNVAVKPVSACKTSEITNEKHIIGKILERDIGTLINREVKYLFFGIFTTYPGIHEV
jgi:hypothetical protein